MSFRIALLLSPFLFFGIIEGSLRLLGYGYSPDFFERATINGQRFWVENDQFGFRFFPPAVARIPVPVRIAAEKAPDVTRIFIFGESAAMGDPCPNFAAARELEVLLRERFPAHRFEIVNTAMTAINSHAVLPIARECAKHRGDIWVVYMGNNEMVGPFGAATVFGRQAPPLRIVRLGLALKKTRAGQLLASLATRILPGARDEAAWHGMEMFLGKSVPPEDPRRGRIYQSFEQNLHDIVQAGVRAGAKVILNTVAVNLKDCSPFDSSIKTNATPDERQAFEQLRAAASEAENSGHLDQAEQRYEQAERIYPLSADVQFGLGRCAAAGSDRAAAQKHLGLACDYDALPFRADSSLNHLVAETAKRFSPGQVLLCDAASLLATNNVAGVAGDETFFEHVHFNFDGNYRLARAWESVIESLLSPEARAKASSRWLTQDECERLLGLSDWNRLAVTEEVIRRLGQPPFTGQKSHESRLNALRLQADSLRRKIAGSPPELARKIYLEALQHAPDDYHLHENFAEFLESTTNLTEALAERQKLVELTPEYYFSAYNLGMVLKSSGQLVKAVSAFERAIQLNPYQGELWLQLGIALARQARWEAALEKFERARHLSPSDPRALLYGAEVLQKLNRSRESSDLLREAIRRQPDYWEAHYRLGEWFSAQEELGPAVAEFETVVRLNSGYLKAHMNLGVALFKLGRVEEAEHQFDEALRLDPQNNLAREFKQRAQTARRTPSP